MVGLLAPVYKEVYKGRAEVRETFRVSKIGTVAGSLVTDGSITRDANVRVTREGVSVHTGKIGSLRRFKDDVSEVRNGMECGIDLAGFKDIHVGDVIEAFTTEKIAAELGQNTAELKRQQMAELKEAKQRENEIAAAPV